jgi:hypothetical protein
MQRADWVFSMCMNINNYLHPGKIPQTNMAVEMVAQLKLHPRIVRVPVRGTIMAIHTFVYKRKRKPMKY